MEQIFQFISADLIWVAVGLILGIGIGALPGMGAGIAIALLMPITYGYETGSVIAFLLGIFVGAVYGASISAILINIPGDSGSVATAIDGYQLTRKGESLTALGASITASSIGGIAGVVVLILLSPLIANFVVYNVDSVSYAWLVFISLTFITQSMQGDISKGIATALFGFMISTIGMDPLTPKLRYTFGNMFLMDGIPFIPLILGMFAITHLLVLSQEDGSSSISQTGELTGSLVKGMKEVFRNIGVTIRSTLIGIGFGILPGIGGATINLLAYLSAKKKYDKGTFGKGDIRGVIAPEASNNACVAATLVPMLTMAIPGGAIAAIFMGVLILHGLTPGPTLFTKDIAFVNRLFISLAAANILLFPVALLTLRPFAQIAVVKLNRLIPVILVLVIFGALGINGMYFDVIVALIAGLISYFFMQFGYPILPFLMAFILGPIFEVNVRRALLISKGDFSIFLSQPLHWVLAISFILVILGPKLYELLFRRNKESNVNNSESDSI